MEAWVVDVWVGGVVGPGSRFRFFFSRNLKDVVDIRNHLNHAKYLGW